MEPKSEVIMEPKSKVMEPNSEIMEPKSEVMEPNSEVMEPKSEEPEVMDDSELQQHAKTGDVKQSNEQTQMEDQAKPEEQLQGVEKAASTEHKLQTEPVKQLSEPMEEEGKPKQRALGVNLESLNEVESPDSDLTEYQIQFVEDMSVRSLSDGKLYVSEMHGLLFEGSHQLQIPFKDVRWISRRGLVTDGSESIVLSYEDPASREISYIFFISQQLQYRDLETIGNLKISESTNFGMCKDGDMARLLRVLEEQPIDIRRIVMKVKSEGHGADTPQIFYMVVDLECISFFKDSTKNVDYQIKFWEDEGPNVVEFVKVIRQEQQIQIETDRFFFTLNEPTQILETNTWVRLNWNDCQLVWNATETGINNIVVPYETIWVPDITLYDNAQNELGGAEGYRPNIYPDGSVSYNFPSVIKSLCKVDVTYFPFDTQTCEMMFGSWSYHGYDLNVTKKADFGDTSSYVSNGEWHIVGMPVIRHEFFYGCCPEPYPDITFYIQLQRKPLFYLLNLLFPCTLISTIAILGFLLPPDSGEKVSLEITVLLSLAVFLLVVSETMPPTSETFPFIGLYFALAMLLVSFSCLMTVTVLNLHFQGHFGKKVPHWVRHVFLNCLGRALKVKTRAMYRDSERLAANKVADLNVHDNYAFVAVNENGDHRHQNGGLDVRDNNLNNRKSTTEIKEIKQLNIADLEIQDYSKSSNEVVTVLKKQLDNLNDIKEYMDQKKRLEENVEEWQKLAQVVDRMFMIVFLVVQVTTVLGIIVRISIGEPIPPVE